MIRLDEFAAHRDNSAYILFVVLLSQDGHADARATLVNGVYRFRLRQLLQ